MDTEVQLHAAKTAEASRYAPYEWTLANAYYLKSKEELGTSDYAVAIDFAEKSAKYARQAKDKAMAASGSDYSGMNHE